MGGDKNARPMLIQEKKEKEKGNVSATLGAERGDMSRDAVNLSNGTENFGRMLMVR